MKRKEYETELIRLYDLAMQVQNFRLAFEILEAGRVAGIDSFTEVEQDKP